MVLARWGLMPFWMKEKPKIPHINARAETVESQPMFREAFQRRRALIPATGFFEWKAVVDGKQPYRFVRKDRKPFAFGGLWEFNKRLDEEKPSATIIVGEPNELVAGVHHRMPVMLLAEDYDRWLDPATPAAELKAMLRPYDASLMEAYTVSRVVNSVKNNVPECIVPISDEGLGLR